MGAGGDGVTFLYGVLAGAGFVTLLGIWANGHAYRNGFWDGVKWEREGPSYPSKPGSTWWGWKQLEKKRDA